MDPMGLLKSHQEVREIISYKILSITENISFATRTVMMQHA
jgi:hypothetical protein